MFCKAKTDIMTTRPIHLLYCLLLLSIIACTPQAAGPTTTDANQSTSPSQPTPDPRAAAQDGLSPCPKFSDAPNPDDAETNYVIYRQQLKAGDQEAALNTWRKVYAVSPAADGQRPTVYTDGVAFYNYLIEQNPDQANAYGDTILQLYSQARECYPGDGYMAAIQAFDSYYKYKDIATDDEIYELFKESIEMDGAEDLQYFVINPMSRLVVDMHQADKIDDAEAKNIVDALRTRLQKGLDECQGDQCEAWNTIAAYAPSSLQYFETVKGFYDCAYYVDQYYPDFQENATECDNITIAYSRMRWGDCEDGNPQFQEVRTAYQENCATVATTGGGGTGGLVRQGYDALREGNSQEAVEKLREAAEQTEDSERKGRLLLTVAKIYYRDMRNFSQARNYARQAAQADPTNGEPYILIGTLYASSGPLCGPGTGFDSQVVVWPAIDQWQRAKSVDSSVAGKANQLIGRYTQYMPSRADIFQRGIEEGSTYRVGCWINESTRVRTP